VIDPLDPKAQRTITKGAGDKYTHHRGIYIGWSKTTIDGVGKFDTWHMKNGVRQIYRKILDHKASAEKAKLTVAIDWVAKDKTILTEKRTLIVHAPEAHGAFTLDKISEITAVAGDTDLNGDPEHAGCQYRAHEAVVKNKSAKYLFPEGVKKVQDERDMPWAALTYQIDGRPYHVQHMSHPSIPKGNRYSAYRDYGRFGAFFVTKIAQGDSVTFRIRFHIAPGGFPDNAQAVMAKRYEQYVQSVKP